MFGHRTQQNTLNRTTLYSFVFGNACVKLIAWVVFVYLFTSPALPVFADEELDTSSPEETVEKIIDVVEDEPDLVTEEVVEVEEVVEHDVEQNQEDELAEPTLSEDKVLNEENEAISPVETMEQESPVNLAEDLEQEQFSSETSSSSEVVTVVTEEDISEVLNNEQENYFSDSDVEDVTDSNKSSDDNLTGTSTVEIGDEAEVIAEVDASSTAEEITNLVEDTSSSSEVSGGDSDDSEIIIANNSSATTSTSSTSVSEVDKDNNDTLTGVDHEEDEALEEGLDKSESSEVQDVLETTVTIATTSATTSDDEILDMASSSDGSSVSTSTSTNSPIADSTSAFEFSQTECRAVGDGSYYCTDAKQADSITEDSVFSAPDKDGDLEIYVRIDGEQTKLTDNLVDDSAPSYDPLSDRIVWHSLINDRYQIISYDIKSKKTTQLTDTTYNNMQPMAYGDLVFWQAWIEDNWEIVRLDGNEVIQMTDNKVHDISPYAQDNYVMWQTQDGDSWKTSLYDISTGQHQFIDADTDGVTKNPRLVLMYESYDANGDVKVLGYDLKNKKYINLAQVPTSIPDELPGPAEDNEELAFIQAKPTVREGEDNADIASNSGPSPVPNPSNASTSTKTSIIDLNNDPTTASSSGDVVVPDFAVGAIATSTDVSEIADLDLSEMVTRDQAEAEVDRLLEEALVEKAVEHIEDVVIPPVASSSDEVVG